MDDKDELWMVKKRDGRTSDAVLSCPACFTTVCLECQRHEQYVTQYRAVFVVNCKVDKDRVLRHNATPSTVGKRMRDSEKRETVSADDETVNPVFCSTCSTEIGVVDSEEIYHFSNWQKIKQPSQSKTRDDVDHSDWLSNRRKSKKASPFAKED